MIKQCWKRLLVFSLLMITANIDGSIAKAADIRANGWLGSKTAYSQRSGLGQIYPQNDMTGSSYTHMRGRFLFEFLPNEFGGIVWQNEIDFNYGDGAFDNGRGKGGGLGTDTVNLETKHLYLHFAIPDTTLKAKIGISPVSDDFNSVVLGTDTAGFTMDYFTSIDNFRFGAYRFWDQEIESVSDNVDFFTFSVKRELSSHARGGLAAYLLKDRGNKGNGALNQSGGNTRNIDGLAYLSNNSATSNAAIIPGNQTYDLNSYFIGLFGETQINDKFTLDGWGLYNFGSVSLENKSDIDISGLALDLRVQTELGSTPISHSTGQKRVKVNLTI